jgi:hypothetical protein
VSEQNGGAVPGVDFNALLGDPSTNPEPATALGKSLAAVTPEDAAASTAQDAHFSFRDLLTEQQRADLERSAPAVAAQMINDHHAIINFGAPVLEKLSAMSTQLLEAQKDIKIPEAEAIVNDLLREIDGFNKKWRNQKLEDTVHKITKWIRRTAYSLKTLAREAKPIAEKIDLAEIKLKEMELKLADNVTRGQQLHKNTTSTLEGVVAVLAALEQIIDVAKQQFAEADAALKGTDAKGGAADGLVSLAYGGRTVSLNELREIHANLAAGVSELEKTWFDWRQQFFLGYAQAPPSATSSSYRQRCSAAARCSARWACRRHARRWRCGSRPCSPARVPRWLTPCSAARTN